MKTIQTVAVASLVVSAATAAGDANAAVDTFLKVDSIKGDATMRGYEGDIVVSSVELSATATNTATTGTGVASGKRQFSPVVIQKVTDRSSVSLFKAFVQGEHLKNVEIDFVKSTAQGAMQFLKIDLGDAVVSSYSLSSDAGGRPTESISFNYLKIEETYTPQSAAGGAEASISASYDIAAQKLQ
jgi:type VI secretion system secreted protein Hcp